MKIILAGALLTLSTLAHAITAQSYIVMDMDGVVITEKNADELRSIASITKLFTAEKNAELPRDEPIMITREDVKDGHMRSSLLKAGSTHTRGVLLDLALVNSDNIAAIALGRSSSIELVLPPEITYVEASGLDPRNGSTARALADYVRTTLYQTELATLSIQPNVTLGDKIRRSTNPLISSTSWEFFLSKTGFIKSSGGCIVVLMRLKDKIVAVVILGSTTVRQRWCDLAALRTELGDVGFEQPRCSSGKKKIKKKRK